MKYQQKLFGNPVEIIKYEQKFIRNRVAISMICQRKSIGNLVKIYLEIENWKQEIGNYIKIQKTLNSIHWKYSWNSIANSMEYQWGQQ